MAIQKIISSGKAGAEKAALDVAIEYGIPHGGWMTRRRKSGKEKNPCKYRLHELTTIDYEKATLINVVASDGTLILSRGILTGLLALAQRSAKKQNRSCLYIDLDIVSEYKAVEIIIRWIDSKRIGVLNVVGANPDKEPEIYDTTERILKSVMYPPPEKITARYPKSVREAVERLIKLMPLHEKVVLSKLHQNDLHLLNNTIGAYIRESYGLFDKDSPLWLSIHAEYGGTLDHEDAATVVIIRELWKKLKDTYALRVVR